MVSNVVLRVHLALLHEDPFIGKVSIESWKQKLIDMGYRENRKRGKGGKI